MANEIQIGDHCADVRRDRSAAVAGGEAPLKPVSIGTDKMVSPAAPIPAQPGAVHPDPLRIGEGGVDQMASAQQGQTTAVGPATIDEIREQWRRRQNWHRAEKSLTLQAKALCRRLAEGGDVKEADAIFKAAYGKGEHVMADIALAATFPLIEARDSVAKHRVAVEKRLNKLARSLPVAPWVESVRGVGLASLAAIVGEAGDLSNYDGPAKLWKRLGLAVMPDGTRQRRVAGDAAMDHGYSPARRSVVWNIGACIVKAGGPLKAVYDTRKAYEAERVETKAHAHNRAQRYVEKRFLRALWVAWRRAEGTTPVAVDPVRELSPSAE